MKIQDLARNLTPDSHGIWVGRNTHMKISYPEEGNQQYFQIEDKSFWFKHRSNCIVAALNLYPPAGPIFDVGGGNGFVTRRLLDEGFEATLIEPGLNGSFNAKTKRNIPNVFRATLQDCGFPKDSLSAISLFDVLEHIEDDGKFLTEVSTCLKPGGYLYLTVPAFKWLWSMSDINADHYRRYNSKELVYLLSEHFNVLFITCFFRALVFPVLVFRVVPYRLGSAKSRKVPSIAKKHGLNGGLPVRAIQRFLSQEAGHIASGQSKALGTSCLCIAQKRI
ncbi:MAG: class I SAM-dependent methyltransferase [Candidatus Aegiribacteria sp.]|nr:class I SAM-dependent methyltransferase [Candidatus Aegiribacteria sp.]